MLTHLNALAHNLLTWFQRDLAARWPAIAQLDLLRLIREVLQLNGRIFSQGQTISLIVLSADDPIAEDLLVTLRHLLLPWHIVVTLDKT